MSAFESSLHSPGIKIYRVKGAISGDDIETWRDELESFMKENEARTACGLLIDIVEADSISTEAIDGLMDILGEPDEVLDEAMRIRFALIGVKPFTQRFFRESMSQGTMKNFRARFFHEVAEEEAIAWLQAMVTTASKEAGIVDEIPDEKEDKPEKKETPKGAKEATDDVKGEEKKAPEASKAPEKDVVKQDKKEEPVDSKVDDKKTDEQSDGDKKKTGIGALLARPSASKEKTADKSTG